MLYFAYGSNLHIEQMSRRCPAAVKVGVLVLPNTRLVFRGVADVISEDGVECPGGIWRITPECERALDRYEGFNPTNPDNGMYTKEYVTMDGLPDGETEIMLYTMNSRGIYPPSSHYYDVIRQGYRDFGLDAAPLKVALKHSHDCKAPSHIERKRTRRMGRPVLKPRPVSKSALKAERKAARKLNGAERKANAQVFHDPWANVPAEQRRKKVMNLTDWLKDRKHSGERF